MSLWAVLGIAIRRWFITVPVLGFAALAIAVVPTNPISSYPATAELLLQGPTHVDQAVFAGNRPIGTQVVAVNPLGHNYDGRLQQLATDLVTVETSDSARLAVEAAGLDKSYEISLDPSRLTVMYLSVETTNPSTSVRTLQFVTQQISNMLAARSQPGGSLPTQHLSVEVLDAPRTYGLDRSTPMRKDATLGLLGLAAALTAAVVFDRTVLRLRSRVGRRRSTHLVGAHVDKHALTSR